MKRELVRLCDGNASDWDIRQYCYNMVMTDDEDKFIYPEPFKHPWDINYPNFSNEYASELDVDEPSPYTRSKRKLERVTAKDVIKSDYTMDLYNVLFAARDIEPCKKKLTRYRGLKIEEMSVIDDPIEFIDIFSKDIGELLVISYRNDTIIFEDGKSYLVEDIPNIDPKYAVRKITDNVYLGYFRSGCVRIEI